MEEQIVPIGELESWLAKKTDEELKGVYSESDKIRRNLTDLIQSIRQIAEETGEVELKRVLINATSKAADITSIEILSFGDILKLRERSIQFMTYLSDAWRAYQRIVQKGKKVSKLSLLAQVKRVSGEIAKLDSLVSKNSARVESLESCKKQAEGLIYRVERIRKTPEKYLGSKLELLRQELSNNVTLMEQLASSNEFENSLRLKKEISVLNARKREIESQVSHCLLALVRPISKYGYAANLDKEKKRTVESYFEETASALSVPREAALKEILNDVKRYILQGRIEIKNPQKTMMIIEQISTELPDLGNEYRELDERIGRFRSQIDAETEESVGKMQAKMTDLRKAISEVESDLEEVRQAQPKIYSEMQTSTSQVEKMVYENFGTKLRIIMPSEMERPEYTSN